MATPSSYPKKAWEKHAQTYFWTKERIQSANDSSNMMMNMK